MTWLEGDILISLITKLHTYFNFTTNTLALLTYKDLISRVFFSCLCSHFRHAFLKNFDMPLKAMMVNSRGWEL